MNRLPQADQYGNFWLGRDHKACAAIFPRKELRRTNAGCTVERCGGFTLWLGCDLGFATDNGYRRTEYATARAALEAFRELG